MGDALGELVSDTDGVGEQEIVADGVCVGVCVGENVIVVVFDEVGV